MRYYRSAQFVPMKGTAAMYYETDDEGNVTRFMTAFPSTGEVERMAKPPMKRLFRPEMLDSIDVEEFDRFWDS